MKNKILSIALIAIATTICSCNKKGSSTENNGNQGNNSSQQNTTEDKDFFKCTINGNGLNNYNLSKEYDTKDVTATYQELNSPTGKYLWLDFPAGIKNFKLSTYALTPGKYSISDVAELDKHVVTFSNSINSKFITFRSKSGEVNITSVSVKETEAGKGVVNIEGTFSGTFIDEENNEYTSSGTFRSGENF